MIESVAAPGVIYLLTMTIEAETAFHDDEYAKAEHEEKLPARLDAFRARFRSITAVPYWRNGVSYYSDARGLSLRLACPDANWSGVRVLDVGCGLGELGLGLASMGAEVDSFDLSSVGIKRASLAANRYSLPNARFRVANAERLPYESGKFDVAIGWGVLHHLVKYPAAAAELARVMRLGSRLVWQETWGENPILNAGRRRFTLAAEDAGDVFVTYPILRAWCASHFLIEEVRHLSVAYSLKRFTNPQARTPARLLTWQKIALAMLQGIDQVLTRLPLVKRLGAEAVIVLRVPNKRAV